MNFFQRIKDGAGKVTDRAQNAVEIGRLNTQIANIEREMDLYFQRMGEVFYEGYTRKDMSNAEKEMLELAKTCDLLSEERSEVRAKIAELKNERLCVSCGKAVAEDALFCQYCGHKLEKSKEARPSRKIDDEPVIAAEPHKLPDPLAKFTGPLTDDTIIYREPKEPKELKELKEQALDPELEELRRAESEQEARRQAELERERRRQEELDRRIRTWKDNVDPKQQVSSTLETAIPTVTCQICSAELVKGTKWCPHCGSEQI